MFKKIIIRYFATIFLFSLQPFALAALTGPFHESHMKEIFFSKTPIVLGQEDPLQMINEFLPTDNIYGVIYYDGGADDWGAEDYAFIDFTVNGEPGSYVLSIDMRPLKRDNLSYLKLEIVPIPQNAIMRNQAQQWAERVFSTFQSGNNVVSINMYGIEAEFTIKNWEALHYDIIHANAVEAEALVEISEAQHTELPEYFSTHSQSKFTDSDLTEENIIRYFQAGYSDIFKQMLKIAYPDTTEEWNVIKDGFDFPIRQQTGNMGFLYQRPEGACYYVYVPFIKDYLGGGEYDSPIVFIQGEERAGHIRVDCAKGGLPSDLIDVVVPPVAIECDEEPMLNEMDEQFIVHIPQLVYGGNYFTVNLQAEISSIDSVILTLLDYAPITPAIPSCDSEVTLDENFVMNIPTVALDTNKLNHARNLVFNLMQSSDENIRFELNISCATQRGENRC